MQTIVISGYFSWIHVGHIEYFKRASKYGKVIVIVNNDKQQILKYGKIIVPLNERIKVLENNKYIYKVVKSIDTDRTVCKTLKKIKPNYFGNGGDRNKKNVPEDKICKELGIKMKFGLGNKIQSSSWLIKKLNTRK
jgi:cytidyltransferase-like protein